MVVEITEVSMEITLGLTFFTPFICITLIQAKLSGKMHYNTSLLREII